MREKKSVNEPRHPFLSSKKVAYTCGLYNPMHYLEVTLLCYLLPSKCAHAWSLLTHASSLSGPARDIWGFPTLRGKHRSRTALERVHKALQPGHFLLQKHHRIGFSGSSESLAATSLFLIMVLLRNEKNPLGNSYILVCNGECSLLETFSERFSFNGFLQFSLQPDHCISAI